MKNFNIFYHDFWYFDTFYTLHWHLPKHCQVLPYSIARNSQEPKAKIFFEIQKGFLRAVLTGNGHPSPVGILQKKHFSTPVCNLKIVWAKWLHLKGYESAIVWIYPKNVSGSVQLRPAPSRVKLDYLKNPSQDFKNSFHLWFPWISSNAARQN